MMKADLFGFRIFTGVVEDIDDPKKLGRVRVRIHGIHTDKTDLEISEGNGLPFENVPWANVMMSCNSASIHGFGESHGLLPGAWVVGLSRDGELYNDSIIIGSLLGQPTEENPNGSSNDLTAFFGKDGLWPDKEFLDEPDINRHTRNELSYDDERWKPVPTIKDDEQLKNIEKAFGGTWDELKTPYAAEYPHNKTRSGPSGSLFEFDETPGAERIAEFHGPSHSYREIHPDGSQQIKIVGDNYEIVLKDKNLSVEGELNITCNGNTNILSKGNLNIETKGNTKLKTTDLTAIVENQADISAKNAKIDVDNFLNISAGNGINLDAGSGSCFIRGQSVILRGQKTKVF